jgi:hypothetical protein
MTPEFEFVIGDDPDHEDLVAEITYGNELVCMLTMEQGFDLLQLEIHPRKDCQPWCFAEQEFEDFLLKAKRRLGELRKSNT